MSDVSRSGSQGFTLLEVIVALAILGISVGVLFRVFSQQLDRTTGMETEAVATSLAQSLLADASAGDALTDGDKTGQFHNGFRWRIHTEPYGDAEDREAWPVAAKKLSVAVSWGDGGRQKSIVLTTLRLTAKEPPQ
jgi:general secretion pathway protein I